MEVTGAGRPAWGIDAWLDTVHRSLYLRPRTKIPPLDAAVMKIRNSLRSAKIRDKNCRVVRRHGRVYVINKLKPRMKARQG